MNRLRTGLREAPEDPPDREPPPRGADVRVAALLLPPRDRPARAKARTRGPRSGDHGHPTSLAQTGSQKGDPQDTPPERDEPRDDGGGGPEEPPPAHDRPGPDEPMIEVSVSLGLEEALVAAGLTRNVPTYDGWVQITPETYSLLGAVGAGLHPLPPPSRLFQLPVPPAPIQVYWVDVPAARRSELQDAVIAAGGLLVGGVGARYRRVAASSTLINQLLADGVITATAPVPVYQRILGWPGPRGARVESVRLASDGSVHTESTFVSGLAPLSTFGTDFAVLSVRAQPVMRAAGEESGTGVAGDDLESSVYTGAGEAVAVLDTGFDVLPGEGTIHPDFVGLTVMAEQLPLADWAGAEGIVVSSGQLQDWGDSNSCWEAVAEGVGHGTHVIGTIVARPGNTAVVGAPRGVAAGAAVYCQASMMQDQYYHQGLYGTPLDLQPVLLQAFNTNLGTSEAPLFPRVHNNSWNDYGMMNIYEDLARSVDQFVVDHPEMLVVVAAGNTSDGPPSVCAPATAKNALAVGAAQREPDGTRSWRRCSAYGFDSDSQQPFVKPEVLAIGDDVVAPRPVAIPVQFDNGVELDGRLPSADPRRDAYWSKSGTSMAAARVSGTAVALRERLRVDLGRSAPSSALMRAILVNQAGAVAPSSTDLRQVGFGLVQPIPTLEDPEPWLLFDLDEASVTAAAPWTRVITVEAGTPELRVTMAWVDPANDANVASLVRPLRVRLTREGTAERVGWDTTMSSTVQRVVVTNPAAGTWRVDVEALVSTMSGAQAFALVVRGALDAPAELQVACSFRLGAPLGALAFDVSDLARALAIQAAISAAADAEATVTLQDDPTAYPDLPGGTLRVASGTVAAIQGAQWLARFVVAGWGLLAWRRRDPGVVSISLPVRVDEGPLLIAMWGESSALDITTPTVEGVTAAERWLSTPGVVVWRVEPVASTVTLRCDAAAAVQVAVLQWEAAPLNPRITRIGRRIFIRFPGWSGSTIRAVTVTGAGLTTRRAVRIGNTWMVGGLPGGLLNLRVSAIGAGGNWVRASLPVDRSA